MGLKWLLLRYGDPFRQRGKEGLQHLKEMLEAGLSPEYAKDGETLLYDRLMYKEMDYVCLLLQKGADPNHAVVLSLRSPKSSWQTTILVKAFLSGHSFDSLQLLLSYGANYSDLKALEFPQEDVLLSDDERLRSSYESTSGT